MGQLFDLQSLHLSDNKLTGTVLSFLQNLTVLETLDLASNRLSGNIPPSIGGGFAGLRILSLRSNSFAGELPSSLSNLSSLQILDLAQNNLSGNIPATLGDFKAMSQKHYINEYLFYGWFNGVYYEEKLMVNIKGAFQIYTKTLSLVTSLDLSCNNLCGELPGEITKLVGLVVLNLSQNQLSGKIPEAISNLRQLSSFDLSHNRLSGSIPSSMSSLSSLGYLNLSNNNFSGKIPCTGQMSTFSVSSFLGNPGLCGAPLALRCPGNDSGEGAGTVRDVNYDNFSKNVFYLSICSGFAAGVLIPYLILAIRRSWSHAYFLLVDKTVDRLLYLACKTAICFRNLCNY